MDAARFILICLAGWMNRNQQHVIEYLVEEVRVLKEHLGPKRLRFTDPATFGQLSSISTRRPWNSLITGLPSESGIVSIKSRLRRKPSTSECIAQAVIFWFASPSFSNPLMNVSPVLSKN